MVVAEGLLNGLSCGLSKHVVARAQGTLQQEQAAIGPSWVVVAAKGKWGGLGCQLDGSSTPAVTSGEQSWEPSDKA